MKLRILAEAENDLWQSALWYDDRESGVGAKFLMAYEAALDVIRERSETLSVVVGIDSARDVRRRKLLRFPFYVIVERAGNELVVLAVAHSSRRPAYWFSRTVRPTEL